MTRIEEIRERESKATKGPWRVGYNDKYITGHILSDHHKYAGNAVSDPESVCSAETLTADDAEFISHARSDIPFLLAEVERLRAALEAAADYWRLSCGKYDAKYRLTDDANIDEYVLSRIDAALESEAGK